MSKKQSTDASIQLMSADRVARSIDRMAYQIAEDNGDRHNIIVVGLKERGFAIAEQLAEQLKLVTKKKVELIQLTEASGGQTLFNTSAMSTINNKMGYVIVVDDVMFSGQTMLTAIQEVNQYIDASVLGTATLVDRGHRKVPIESTFTGLNSPTKLDEHVQVRVGEGVLQDVVLTKSSK